MHYMYRYYESNEFCADAMSWGDWKFCDYEEMEEILNYILEGYNYQLVTLDLPEKVGVFNRTMVGVNVFEFNMKVASEELNCGHRINWDDAYEVTVFARTRKHADKLVSDILGEARNNQIWYIRMISAKQVYDSV